MISRLNYEKMVEARGVEPLSLRCIHSGFTCVSGFSRPNRTSNRRFDRFATDCNGHWRPDQPGVDNHLLATFDPDQQASSGERGRRLSRQEITVFDSLRQVGVRVVLDRFRLSQEGRDVDHIVVFGI